MSKYNQQSESSNKELIKLNLIFAEQESALLQENLLALHFHT